MKCPHCAVWLAADERGAVAAHACERCGGVWLGVEAGRTLLAPVAAELEHVLATGRPALRCASCGAGMEVWISRRIDVEVDVCRPHGVWLDHGELVHVSNAVAALRGVPATRQEIAYAQWGPPRQAQPGRIGPWADGPRPARRGSGDRGEALALGGEIVGGVAEGVAIGAAAEAAGSVLGRVIGFVVGLLD